MKLSAYCVNQLGLLVYSSGLPLEATDLQLKHFNGVKYCKQDPGSGCQYEAYAVGQFGLISGKKIATSLGLRYILIQNCYRVL